jgi:peptidoglycan/xylan/chitin deacetylase (PgdA/CDA1 family)
MNIKSQHRYSYTPITEHRIGRWPDGKGLAVYVTLGVEDYRFGEGLKENILTEVPNPDLVNTSWRDYGNRVGGFRILERMQSLKIPLSVLLNTSVYESAPALIESLRDAGCEFIGHGVTNSDSLHGRGEQDELLYLQEVRAAIIEREGAMPLGWSSPWLAHTENTIDLLKLAGYDYILDFNMDDRCVWLKSKHGPLLHIPYGVELNDSSTVIGRYASASEFSQMIIDQFDELLRASQRQPLVMSIVLHSFISGQPFRLAAITRALQHIVSHREQIWLTSPGKIYQKVSEDPDLAV